MFEGLNAIPWAELSHAYGSAEEVPVWLRQLTSDDEQVRQRALGRLGGSLEHQGSIYPATAYAVPYLIALLEEPAIQGKYEILGWLAVFYRASPVDEKMWYGEEGTESYGAWGGMPRHIPYKDTHALIEAGLPIYLKLLDAPVLIDRLEAAHLLIHFFAQAQDLWPTLQAALERKPTGAGQADLVLELGRLAKQLPEKQSFFLESFQTAQSKLVRFATALVVARLAKAATSEEVMRLLVRVMWEAPSSLDLYLRFPCGGLIPGVRPCGRCPIWDQRVSRILLHCWRSVSPSTGMPTYWNNSCSCACCSTSSLPRHRTTAIPPGQQKPSPPSNVRPCWCCWNKSSCGMRAPFSAC